MERKSIGQFIAALRKASGMTQAHLAEKLHVSDKAVSRWERDETAPDLTLIPVLAEIFGVTSDEILRGERANPVYAEPPRSNERTQKQIERLLGDTATKFLIRSILSAGVGVVGLLAAMLCNFGFLRANMGFLAGCLFYLAAVVLELVFTVLAFSAIGGEEFAGEKQNEYKQRFLKTAAATFCVPIVLFAATLPLIVFINDTYAGLSAGSWLERGAFFGFWGLVVGFAGWRSLRRIAPKLGLYTLSEEDAQKRARRWKLQKPYLLVLLILLTVTICGWTLLLQCLPPDAFLEGTVFTDFEEFQDYIGTDSISSFYPQAPAPDTAIAPLPAEDARQSDGYPSVEIYKPDGTVAYRYIWRNSSVAQVSYDWLDDGTLQITAYDQLDLARQGLVLSRLWRLGAALCLLEFMVITLAYLSRKTRLGL